MGEYRLSRWQPTRVPRSRLSPITIAARRDQFQDAAPQRGRKGGPNSDHGRQLGIYDPWLGRCRLAQCKSVAGFFAGFWMRESKPVARSKLLVARLKIMTRCDQCAVTHPTCNFAIRMPLHPITPARRPPDLEHARPRLQPRSCNDLGQLRSKVHGGIAQHGNHCVNPQRACIEQLLEN